MSLALVSALEPVVTWIKVDKPVFDLVGVVLGSFRLAGFLLAAALAFGVFMGVLLLRRRRRPGPSPIEAVSLHLGTPETRSDSGDLSHPATPAAL